MPITADVLVPSRAHYKPIVSQNAAKSIDFVGSHHGTTSHPPHLLAAITSVIDDWCQENDPLNRTSLLLGPGVNGGYCRFRAVTKPQISVKDYINRVQRYAECSDTCFILALVYLNRLRSRPVHPVVIDSLSVHRLVITSVMLAAKFFDDRFFRNSLYAFVGGVTTSEINQLESEMFTLLGHNACVTSDEYYQYDAALRYRSHLLLPPHPSAYTPQPASPVTMIQQDFENLLLQQAQNEAHVVHSSQQRQVPLQAPQAVYPTSMTLAQSAPPHNSQDHQYSMAQALPCTGSSPTLSTATSSSSRHSSLTASSSVSTPSDMDCDVPDSIDPNGVVPCDCDTVVVIDARDGSSSLNSVTEKLSSSSLSYSHVTVGSMKIGCGPNPAMQSHEHMVPLMTTSLSRSISAPALPVIR